MTTRRILAVCAAGLLQTGIARGQSITAEAVTTAGYSSDEVAAGAAQVRMFGDLRGDVRYFVESAWAKRTEGESASDSFSAAYPYTNRVQIIEAYAEWMFRPHGLLVGIRGGRFRTPFGIYGGSDHGYSGFLRAPLVRYDEYFALSNNSLEHGANLLVGAPRLTVETSLGAPADVGETERRSALDAIVHAQGYYRAFIVGASYISTSPSRPARLAPGRSAFTGVDMRWMDRGVQLRGEWITGRPFDQATTTGWYVDTLVHRSGMGPVTAVARIERIAHEATDAALDEHARRETIGARIRLMNALSLTVNLVHRSPSDAEYRPRTVDVGVTWSVRSK